MRKRLKKGEPVPSDFARAKKVMKTSEGLMQLSYQNAGYHGCNFEIFWMTRSILCYSMAKKD